MTTNTAEPIERIAGIPVYRHGTAPEHLRSKSQLRVGLRLRLAPGQRPVCYVIPHWHPDERRALYDPADAIPVADQRIGSVWAWRARRTCPKCGVVREHIVHGKQCGVCWRAEQAKLAERQKRRCEDCHRVGSKPLPLTGGFRHWPERLCRSCIAKKRRLKEELLRKAIRCAGGCGKLVATKAQVLEWALTNRRAIPAWKQWCPPCEAAHEAEETRLDAEREARRLKAAAEYAERERKAREARRAELAGLREWAVEVLADPATVILDTETTGLDDGARIVEISITTATGDVLLDTLVNPGVPIPAEASDIHGITDEMVAAAPPFSEVVAELCEAIKGKRVLIYNLSYDLARIEHEFTRLGQAGSWIAVRKTWARWEDAMEPYSAWYGDWSDYWGNYRWQRLNGGHRALGDCLAVIDCLKAMARPSVYEDDESGGVEGG